MKILLESLFVMLDLQEKTFQIFHSSSSSELDEFWDVILQVESTLTKCDTRATVLKQKHGLRLFLEHCCIQRHYMFCVKNVERQSAKFAPLFICQQVCLSRFISFQIRFLVQVKNTTVPFQTCMEHRQVKNIVRLYKKSQSVVHMDYPSTLQASMLRILVKLLNVLSVANSA